MRIILEGPDNAGKTTLAMHLRSHTVVRYHHPGGKPADFAAEMDCCETQLKMLRLEHAILDRVTPISQQVYNPDPDFDVARIEVLRQMVETGAVIIYCRPSVDHLMRHQDFTWRDGETEEHKQKIIHNQHKFIERYDKIMMTVPNICYDFAEPSAEIIRKKAVSALCGSIEDENWFHNLINRRY